MNRVFMCNVFMRSVHMGRISHLLLVVRMARVGLEIRGTPVGVAFCVRRPILVCVYIGRTSRNHSLPVEFTRPWGCRHRRMTVVNGGEHLTVLAGFLRVLHLYVRHRPMCFSLRGKFVCVWSSHRASVPAVVTHPIHGRVVVHHGRVVGVMDDRCVHICDRAVIVVNSASPVPARESHACVSKPIVNAAIESNVWSPVARVPQIGSSAPTPITWSPQQSHRRRHHPRSGNPVIVVISIRPITRSPDIPRSRAGRLHVYGKSWRPDSNGNAYSYLGLRRQRQS
jgi:hypothetical protein